MGVHLIGFEPPAEIPVPNVGPFAGRMWITARPSRPGGEPTLICHKGGRERTLDDCRMCARFAAAVDGPGAGESTVCCVWSHRDPVSARMTDASALVTVDEQTSGADAAALAAQHQIHHLLVVSHQALVGLVCRCDLTDGRATTPVGRYMASEVFAIHPSASLGAAASAMRALRVGCLPVVADGFLVGILTTSDLARAGIPAEAFGR
jgi:acetoin utilization protein AcuB